MGHESKWVSEYVCVCVWERERESVRERERERDSEKEVKKNGLGEDRLPKCIIMNYDYELTFMNADDFGWMYL